MRSPRFFSPAKKNLDFPYLFFFSFLFLRHNEKSIERTRLNYLINVIVIFKRIEKEIGNCEFAIASVKELIYHTNILNLYIYFLILYILFHLILYLSIFFVLLFILWIFLYCCTLTLDNIYHIFFFIKNDICKSISFTLNSFQKCREN